MNTELWTGYGPPICAARTIYLPQSRAAHRQHIATRVQEARGLTAIFMRMAKSEATATAVDVERLRATGQ